MEMCRVCLSTEKEMYSLSETFVIQYNLLTNLNVTLLDGMPQYTCRHCTDTVKYFIEFRDKSIASETTLREICSSLKSEDEKNEVRPHHLKDEIKHEIKLEKPYDSDGGGDNSLDNFDFTFEEYEGNIKDIVKDEDVKPKKRKKHKVKTEKKLKTSKLIEIPEDANWSCGLCPKVFEDKDTLKTHIDVHKDQRRCELCKEHVNSLSQLLAHRLVHVSMKQFHCHICNKRYRSCMYLEHHYRTVHIDTDERSLSCKNCTSKFSTPRRLQSHMLTVHSGETFFCDLCPKTFGNKGNIKSHMQHHMMKKSYICDLCSFSCNYASGLKDHKLRKHSESKMNCKNCTRAFATVEDYDKHKCKKKMQICNVCGLQLTGSSRLSSHMLRHTNIFKYECKRCPAKYKSKAALDAHNDRHDGIRRLQCEYCSAKFYTATVLIKHRRTHTGEKPYVCKVCNKGFTGGNNLKVHMKVHGEYLIVKKNSEQDLINVTK